jgi:hypothetical protein
MCRNIKTLFNFDPPVTDDEIRAAALQFVRKLTGFNKPSQANEAAFERAVDETARVAHKLLDSLITTAAPRNREEEAAKARARGAARFGRSAGAAKVLGGIVALAALAGPALARPQLQTAEPQLFVIARESHNGGLDVGESLFFVFRGGSSRYAALGTTLPDPLPRLAQWALLEAPPSARADLGEALVAAEVGKARDCRLFPDSPEYELEMSLRWFGRRGRQNVFRVSTSRSLPPCPAETEELLAALVAFRVDSQVLESVATP